MSKISGPLLDRIDIHLEVPALPPKEILDQFQAESSCDIKKRTSAARNIQHKRFRKKEIFSNAHMKHKDIKTYCSLDDQCRQLIRSAVEELHLSARSYDRIIKVARTIADLDQEEIIKPEHIAEAIQYRSLDRDGWPS